MSHVLTSRLQYHGIQSLSIKIQKCRIATRILGEQGWRSGESARLPPMWPGFDSRTRRHMWVEFVLVLDPAPRVFLRVLRFSSLSKNRHAAYSSWLLAVLQGHAWTLQRLPAAPIYAFGPTLSSCVLAVLCEGD